MKNYLKKKFNYTKEQIDHILKHTSIKNLSTLVERAYDLTNKLGFIIECLWKMKINYFQDYPS